MCLVPERFEPQTILDIEGQEIPLDWPSGYLEDWDLAKLSTIAILKQMPAIWPTCKSLVRYIINQVVVCKRENGENAEEATNPELETPYEVQNAALEAPNEEKGMGLDPGSGDDSVQMEVWRCSLFNKVEIENQLNQTEPKNEMNHMCRLIIYTMLWRP